MSRTTRGGLFASLPAWFPRIQPARVRWACRCPVHRNGRDHLPAALLRRLRLRMAENELVAPLQQRGSERRSCLDPSSTSVHARHARHHHGGGQIILEHAANPSAMMGQPPTHRLASLCPRDWHACPRPPQFALNDHGSSPRAERLNLRLAIPEHVELTSHPLCNHRLHRGRGWRFLKRLDGRSSRSGDAYRRHHGHRTTSSPRPHCEVRFRRINFAYMSSLGFLDYGVGGHCVKIRGERPRFDELLT